MVQFSTGFVSVSRTMTSDAPQRVVEYDAWFNECNLHCLTNPLYYGSVREQAAPLPVGAYAWFQKGNLKDIFIRNFTGGSNGTVVAVYTPMRV
jgi:hypothetical protein